MIASLVQAHRDDLKRPKGAVGVCGGGAAPAAVLMMVSPFCILNISFEGRVVIASNVSTRLMLGIV